MSFPTCFECGVYTEIESTYRNRIPWSCSHKIYRYDHKTSDHDDLEFQESEVVEDFRPRAYPAKDLMVFPLQSLEDSDLRRIDVGDKYKGQLTPPRIEEEVEITGLVRHRDRIEVFYQEVETA